MLTSHYERCGRYYGLGGGYQGTASEEEKRLTMMLFSGIFDSLGQRVSVLLSTVLDSCYIFDSWGQRVSVLLCTVLDLCYIFDSQGTEDECIVVYI